MNKQELLKIVLEEKKEREFRKEKQESIGELTGNGMSMVEKTAKRFEEKINRLMRYRAITST